MIAFGTIAGGAGAVLTGGNFWQVAVTGLVVCGLNHAMHQMGDEDGPGKRPKTKNDVKKEAVKPSFSKLVEVEGNTLGVVDLVHGSKDMNWVRGSAPKLASAPKFLKVAGNTLGGIGVALEANQVYNGEMSCQNLV